MIDEKRHWFYWIIDCSIHGRADFNNMHYVEPERKKTNFLISECGLNGKPNKPFCKPCNRYFNTHKSMINHRVKRHLKTRIQ